MTTYCAGGRPDGTRDPRCEITRSLLATPASVKVARRLAEAALRSWGLDGMADDVTLVVSELVTNAGRAKPYGEMRLVVFLLPSYVGVEVHDGVPEPPVRRVPVAVDDMAECDAGGRGLLIVDALAEHWDVRPNGDGKAVWALLRIRP